MSRDGVEPLDAVPSTSYAPREYVIVNGLRYVVPYVEDVIYKVSTTREGASVLDCLVGHHAFQGQCVKGGGDRAHWQGELDARRVAIVSDVLARLPTGGDVPERWWATPASLDERVPRDSRLRVRRHVHEPCVHAEAPVVLTEDERVVIVDKPPGLPTLAGVGPGVAGENNAVAVLRRLRASASASAKRKREESDDGGGGGGGGNDDDAPLFAVNRIDKPVSGVWILAKGSRLSARARDALHKGAARGETRKTYVALVKGRVEVGGGGAGGGGFVVDAPLRKDERGLAVVGGDGAKPAATRVVPLAVVAVLSKGGGGEKEALTLAAVALEKSGRYHQIRAHLAHVGHPIVFDRDYDADADGRRDDADDDDDDHADIAADIASADPLTCPGGRAVYADDEERTLLKMTRDAYQPWCLECGLALAALTRADDARAFGGDDAARLAAAREAMTRHAEGADVDDDVADDVADDDAARRRRTKPKTRGRVALHSLEYVFAFDGKRYVARSSRLPAFATAVFERAGANDRFIETCTVDSVCDAASR